MDIHKIIEELQEKASQTDIKRFISDLKFETRFNTLRELIYHVEIYTAEGRPGEADRLLSAAEKISRYIDENASDRNLRDVRSLKTITRKKRAKFHDSQGRREEAIAHYQEIMKGLDMPREENFLGEMLMEIAIIEEQMGKKKDALAKFDRASRIYGKKKDSFNFQAALFNCAHVLYDMSYYSKAEDFCRAVIGHYKNTGKMLSPVAHAYLEMANIYELQGRSENAKIFYKKALDSYRQMNDRIKMSDILNRIGSYEIDDGNPISAAAIFQEALDIKRTVEFLQGKGQLYESMGDQLRWGGNPGEAMNYYYLAFHFFDESGSEARKTILKHKVYKCRETLGPGVEDLGTFVEKFKKKSPEESRVMDLERLDYACTPRECQRPQKEREWLPPHVNRVNRKFLMYLLRNLARVHSILGNEKDFLKYSRLRSLIEKEYRKK
jgi:tetratricopeptide (TPR) repeat protein